MNPFPMRKVGGDAQALASAEGLASADQEGNHDLAACILVKRCKGLLRSCVCIWEMNDTREWLDLWLKIQALAGEAIKNRPTHAIDSIRCAFLKEGRVIKVADELEGSEAHAQVHETQSGLDFVS